MAPEIGQVVQDVLAANWEKELVEKAVSARSQELPGLNPSLIVDELLQSLKVKGQQRKARNLNHWPEYALEAIQRLITKLAKKRRAEIDRFIRRNRKSAFALAHAITDDRVQADEVISDTNFELWTGKLVERYYFLALKRNAYDLIDKRTSARDMFVPLDQAFPESEVDDDEIPVKGASSDSEPVSTYDEDEDPLEILLKRSEEGERERVIQRAMRLAGNSRKYRWIKRKQWSQPLEINA